MYKIVVVGCGNVGMAYSYAVLQQKIPIKELVLIDSNRNILEGKVLDLRHAVENIGIETNIKVGEYKDCEDADIVCITVGPKETNVKGSRMDDLYKIHKILKEIVTQIRKSKFKGIYLVASNPLDVATYLTNQYAKCDTKKVIGSGTLLDTARLHDVLGKKKGYVLGEHGDSQFITWSQIEEQYMQEQKETIEEAVRTMGYQVAEKQGFTCYGIGSALTRITVSILEDKREILPVSTYQETYGVYISNLSKIGREGVIATDLIELSIEEREKKEKSIQIIKTAIGKL